MSLYKSAQLFDGNRLTMGFDYQHIYGRAWYTDRKTGETVTTNQRDVHVRHGKPRVSASRAPLELHTLVAGVDIHF